MYLYNIRDLVIHYFAEYYEGLLEDRSLSLEKLKSAMEVADEADAFIAVLIRRSHSGRGEYAESNLPDEQKNHLEKMRHYQALLKGYIAARENKLV